MSTIGGTIQLRKSLLYQGNNNCSWNNPNNQSSTTISIAGTANGPTPGSLLIATDPGSSVNLSELTLAGEVWMVNYDLTNFVTYGIYETSTTKFFPLGELLAGQVGQLRFSRHLFEEYHGTGTGVASTTQFWMKADTAPVLVYVGAFQA